jgi:hypothetical protein
LGKMEIGVHIMTRDREHLEVKQQEEKERGRAERWEREIRRWKRD